MQRAAIVAVLLLLHFELGHQQQCSINSENVRSKGAKGNGVTDDTVAFSRVESDGGAGVIYMPAGTYRIARSLSLKKPIIAATGAVFKVEATLTLANQPQHPANAFFKFAKNGKVLFTDGTQYVLPEWFGAWGNGKADDSLPIQRAFNSILPTGNAMLYLSKNYGIGKQQQLQFGPGVVITSSSKATFTAVGGNTKGISFLPGNHGIKSVLPNLVGFKDFCLQLQGVAVAALQLRTLTNCGDAIRLLSTGAPQGDMVNTIWFDRIVNSVVGIAIRANNKNCAYPNCVFQGNQFVGTAIQGGPSSGASYAILLSSPASSAPAWDRNTFDIQSITPPNNPSYRMFYCTPSCDAEVLKIGGLGSLANPASRVFGHSGNSGKANDMQINLGLSSALKENQFGLWGEQNIINLSGALVGASGAVRCTTSSNSKRSFNGGRALVGNLHTLQAVPTSNWANGAVREFYFYHQLANGFLYVLKCGAPNNPSTGTPKFDCPQYYDNNNAVAGEVKVWVINQSGATIKAGQAAQFSIAVNTLRNPT